MKRLVLGGLAALTVPLAAYAADHAEAPGSASDPAADIADFFAWHTDEGNLVAIVTFAPLSAPGSTGIYDADVLYGIHFDTNLNGTSDADIWVRYGQNGAGDWGVQVTGIGDSPIEGAVGGLIEGNGAKVWTGAADDPFFFDLQGFQDTLATGTISFDNTRDLLAGMNVTAIVIELPAAGFVGSDGTVSTWTTTARK